MNRLQAELQRLYLPPAAERGAAEAGQPALTAADGRTRAMVLELAGAASWDKLAPVWRGVQADFQLPAPAIAVTGIDGFQLWFSLAEPVPAGQALALLEGLRRRYLGAVLPERIRMTPSATAATGRAQPPSLPPVQAQPGRWSAFVAPDLAPLFEDEACLDLPPGPDAQADLLARLQSTRLADFTRALERLGPGDAAVPGDSHTAGAAAGPASARAPWPGGGPDPRTFLLEVMHDPAIDLHLRIEAAKALLPYSGSQPRPSH